MADFTNEKILLEEICKGNEQAFEFLFKSYYPRLRGYASRFVRDDEAVRDIVQESFLKFWEKRNIIEAVSISSLLFAMVRNACINYLRHLQIAEQHNIDYLATIDGHEELYTLDFNLTPEHELLYNELQEQVKIVMDSLPPRCREVFLMSRFNKMKNREIADKLNVSTTAVEKHIAKALACFAQHFKEKYPMDVYIAILAWLLQE